MTVIQLTLRDPITNCNNFVTWHSHVTDPVEIASLVDPIALRYSELMINSAQLRFVSFNPDGERIIAYLSEEVSLPGAILPTSDSGFTTHSSCIYYKVVTSDKARYRRKLTWSFYLEHLDGYNLDSTLCDYLEDRLTSFYDNTDFELYASNYKRIKFDSMNRFISHQNSYRYPRRFLKNHWFPEY